MATIEIVGVIKAELEMKTESSVEIGLDDILNLYEESVPNLSSRQSFPTNPFGERKNILKTETDDEEKLFKEERKGADEDFRIANNLGTGERMILNFQQFSYQVSGKDKDCGNGNKTIRAKLCNNFETVVCQKSTKKAIVTKAPESTAIIEPHEFKKLSSTEHVCNHCQCVFKNLRGVKRHIRLNHRDVTDTYRCPYCPFNSNQNTIGQHILLRHTNENEIEWFECQKCDKKFKMKYFLTAHMHTHLSSAELSSVSKPCSICSKCFKTTRSLNRHIKWVHNREAEKGIQCEKCGYSTRKASDMRRHVEVSHFSSEQRQTYECDKCDYKTTYEYQFKDHCKKHKTQFCCEKCAFIANSPTHLKLHQITHQTEIDEQDLKYECDKCDYKTYRVYSFSVHKLNHLEPHEIQYFYCYHCDFKAKRKDNLKTHVVRHFKKEEVDFQCFICDFSTKKRTLLTKHLKKHSETQTRLQTTDSILES